jgi:uncharacterized protein YdaU (DUF1376 family)
LDTYYTTEKPLPTDHSKVCRLVLAATEVQRAAVQIILEEFFTLTDAGWINGRANEEILAMREKVQAVEEKDGHEKTRKERYRERRAFLFAFLRERDEVPAYDIGMKELQESATAKGWAGTFKSVPSVPVASGITPVPAVPVERTGNVSGNAASTAIPIPTPTPIPIPKKNTVSSPLAPDPAKLDPKGSRLPTDWTLPDDWAAWCEENRPDLDPMIVADGFRDFWIGKAGKDGRKADWLATWRNWCRSQKPGTRQPRAGDWTGGAL